MREIDWSEITKQIGCLTSQLDSASTYEDTIDIQQRIDLLTTNSITETNENTVSLRPINRNHAFLFAKLYCNLWLAQVRTMPLEETTAHQPTIEELEGDELDPLEGRIIYDDNYVDAEERLLLTAIGEGENGNYAYVTNILSEACDGTDEDLEYGNILSLDAVPSVDGYRLSLCRGYLATVLSKEYEIS